MCFSKYPDKFHIDQEGWLLLSQLENLHHHCCIPLPTLNYSFWHTLGFAKRHFGECRSLYLKVEWKYTKSSFSYNVISYIKIFNIWCFFNVYPVISFCISKHLRGDTASVSKVAKPSVLFGFRSWSCMFPPLQDHWYSEYSWKWGAIKALWALVRVARVKLGCKLKLNSIQ